MRTGSQRIFAWVVVAVPVAAWAGGAYFPWSQILPGGFQGFADDPDSDRRPNGIEFVTGTDGDIPDPGGSLVLGEVTEGLERFATVAFDLESPSFDDVTVTVEGSGDLGDWEPVATLAPGTGWQGSGTVDAVPQPSGTGVQVTVRDAVPFSATSPRFLRLTVAWNPLDSDGDGMSDLWEEANGLDPDSVDDHLDLDQDGLSNGQEHSLGTLANRRDSNGNGVLDGFESATGSVPSRPDSMETSPHPRTGLRVHLPLPSP